VAYKSWDDHSARWKREHSKAGESRELWNRWLKLTPSSRKASSIRDYAKGTPVRVQRTERKRRDVASKVAKSIIGSEHIVERGVHMMTPDELRWTAGASRSAISKRAREQPFRDAKGRAIPDDPRYKYIRNGWNPWWYKGSN